MVDRTLNLGKVAHVAQCAISGLDSSGHRCVHCIPDVLEQPDAIAVGGRKTECALALTLYERHPSDLILFQFLRVQKWAWACSAERRRVETRHLLIGRGELGIGADGLLGEGSRLATIEACSMDGGGAEQSDGAESKVHLNLKFYRISSRAAVCPEQLFLRFAPTPQLHNVAVNLFAVSIRQVHLFLRVAIEIEQFRAPGAKVIDELARAIAQSQQVQRVIDEEERRARPAIEYRAALI